MKLCKDHGKKRSLSPEGYALVARPGVRSRCVGLHRLVYCSNNEKTLKDIEGKVVRHTCDNTRCIEPTHLVLGTLTDNNKDRASRGRSAVTVPSRQTLTDSDVKYIKDNYIKGSNTRGLKYFATLFGVHLSYISRIIAGQERA